MASDGEIALSGQVDVETQQRTHRTSFRWYGDLARSVRAARVAST